MFKKKANIKTLSPLRSSDRRKTADRIIADFGIEAQPTTQHGTDVAGNEPRSSEAEAEAKAAATAAHTSLRNLILPDNCLTAKFTTTSGPDLKEVHGLVYVGSHTSGEQRILWVSLNDRLYPSVYALWKIPCLLPLLHTPNVVVKKIQGGADLMTPGLAGPPFPAKARQEAIVAIASLESPSVPVAVGTCKVDISSLKSVQGVKGCAVEIFHWAGDELWDWSTSGKSGSAVPESLEGWIEADDEVTNGTQALDLEDDEDSGGVSLPPSISQNPPPRNEYVDGEDAVAEAIDVDAGDDMTTQEIDDAFRNAFLYGIHHHKTTNSSQPGFGLFFPLSQSFVMSNLVLPFLPAFTPKQSEALVIKKTSWKTIRKFIKALDKEKLLLSKDRQGNETSVMTIDFDDPAFLDFKPYRLPKKEDANQAPSKPDPQTSNTTSDDIGQKLNKIDLYRAKDSLAPLFLHSSANPKSQHSLADMKSIINAYIDAEHLQHSTNKRLINLDPILSNALFNPSTSNIDAEVLARGSINRDALMDRIVKDYCTPCYAILRNSETISSPKVKVKTGPAPKIEVQQETRSGNKTVTRVWGLDPYYVNAQPLADELRKVCAGSTSVEMSKHGHGLEVMVQGPQKDAVIAALERRGVQKQWIEVHKMKSKKK